MSEQRGMNTVYLSWLESCHFHFYLPLLLVQSPLQELDNINHILWMDFQDSAKFTAALYKGEV